MADQDAADILSRAHQTATAGAALSKKTIAAQREQLKRERQTQESIEDYAKRHGLTLHIQPAKPTKGTAQ